MLTPEGNQPVPCFHDFRISIGVTLPGRYWVDTSECCFTMLPHFILSQTLKMIFGVCNDEVRKKMMDFTNGYSLRIWSVFCFWGLYEFGMTREATLKINLSTLVRFH